MITKYLCNISSFITHLDLLLTELTVYRFIRLNILSVLKTVDHTSILFFYAFDYTGDWSDLGLGLGLVGFGLGLARLGCSRHQSHCLLVSLTFLVFCRTGVTRVLQKVSSGVSSPFAGA